MNFGVFASGSDNVFACLPVVVITLCVLACCALKKIVFLAVVMTYSVFDCCHDYLCACLMLLLLVYLPVVITFGGLASCFDFCVYLTMLL